MSNFNSMINGRPATMPSIHTRFKHCMHTELPTIETVMETSRQQQQEEEQKLQAPIIKELAREIFSRQNKKAKKVYSTWENFERINPNAARSYRIKAEIKHQEALEEMAKEEAQLAHQAELLRRRIEKEEREEEDKAMRLEEARRISSRRAQRVKDRDSEENMEGKYEVIEGVEEGDKCEDEGIVKTEIKQWKERSLMGEGMDVAHMTQIMSVV